MDDLVGQQGKHTPNLVQKHVLRASLRSAKLGHLDNYEAYDAKQVQASQQRLLILSSSCPLSL
jgi:hypothetical protein